MSHPLLDLLQEKQRALEKQGSLKTEHFIASSQGAKIELYNTHKLLNLCANNYLGLAQHPVLQRSAIQALEEWGWGMASVRFICGSHISHQKLEARLSQFLHTEDSLLYSSCFDANGGLFEALFEAKDAIISDAFNHASIIDGIRLCKAERLIYSNHNMTELEERLKASQRNRFRLIVTDGVFSMDGSIAKLESICELAQRYQALVMVDDSHAVGILGPHGKGSAEHCGVLDQIDIITGTLGKALGGALGGYTASHKPIIDWLRQRSRPYIFSNALPPFMAKASLAALDFIEQNPNLRLRLFQNSEFLKQSLRELGFDLPHNLHPILPLMLKEKATAQKMAAELFKEGVLTAAIVYPVVPQNQPRLRLQVSAAHEIADLKASIPVFKKVGLALGVIQ